MKKVLAEIDHETDVIDDLSRHARETKYGKVNGGAHRPLEAAAEDLYERVKEGRDEHQGRGWLQGLVEIKTKDANLDWQLDNASSWRSTRAWCPRNYCIVDRDGLQDEVAGGRDRGGSQRDARAVSTGGDPGTCDPPNTPP